MPKPHILMISGDSSIATKNKGVFYDMLVEFSKYFNHIDILCPKPQKVKRRSLGKNVSIYPTSSGLLQVPYGFYKAYRLAKKNKYDLVIVHGYGYFHNGWIGLFLHKKFSIPYVLEIFHLDGYPDIRNFSNLFFRYWGTLNIKVLSHYAIAVRVMNNQIKDWLIKSNLVVRNKVIKIPAIFVDKNIFHPIKMTKPIDLLWVGRLENNKNIQAFLKAISEMTYKPLSVFVVGKGQQEHIIEQFKENIPPLIIFRHISYVKTRKKLSEYYQKSKIIVCTSHVEGGPRVTVEAAASGAAILSSDVGIMNEVVTEKKLGYIYDGTISDFKEKAQRLLNDEQLRNKFIKNGIAYAKKLSVSKVIGNHAHEYIKLIKSTAGDK